MRVPPGGGGKPAAGPAPGAGSGCEAESPVDGTGRAAPGTRSSGATAAGAAGLIKHHAAGNVPEGKTWVITVTGHGLKDPDWALRNADGSSVEPTKVPFDVVEIATALGLQE